MSAVYPAVKVFTDMKIVVIDDDATSLALIEKRLRQHGYTHISPVLSPEQGMALVQKEQPDLIILDIIMPVMDGYTFCRAVRADKRLSSVPVIMISGGALDSDDVMRETFGAGATDFISKPIRASELLARVQAALRLKQVNDGLLEEIKRRKDTEDRLRRSEERFRAIAATTPNAVIIADCDFNIVYWNEGSEKMLGYAEEEAIGRSVSLITAKQFKVIHTPERAKAIDPGSSAALTQTIESYALTKDGTELPVEISTSLWREGDEMFFGAIMRDITLRKHNEQKREELIGQLQKALGEIKTLSGLLPICSSCKKIRDDQGYWSKIETYISTHSEAEFTHGICPECAKKLYPDFQKKREKKKGERAGDAVP